MYFLAVLCLPRAPALANIGSSMHPVRFGVQTRQSDSLTRWAALLTLRPFRGVQAHFSNAIDVRVLQLAMDLRGRVLHADSPGPLDAGNCECPAKCWPPGRLYKFGQARVDLATYEWY